MLHFGAYRSIFTLKKKKIHPKANMNVEWEGGTRKRLAPHPQLPRGRGAQRPSVVVTEVFCAFPVSLSAWLVPVTLIS